MKQLRNSTLILVLSLLSVATGYIVGHNHGFTDGVKIGKIDAMFEKAGTCLYHNGQKECSK